MPTNHSSTDAQLKRDREICEAAEKGPWWWEQCYELDGLHWALCNPTSSNEGRVIDASLILNLSLPNWFEFKPASENPNWKFIAHARNRMPELLDEIERLRAILKSVEWGGTIVCDNNEYMCCPECAGLIRPAADQYVAGRYPAGHDPDCNLAAAVGAETRSPAENEELRKGK